MDHDLVAGLPVRDALADLPDDAGGVGAADVVAVLGVVAVAEDRDRLAERRPDVVEVDAGGHHADDHLEGAGLRDLDLLDLEGVLGLALALLADHPGGHRLGQRPRAPRRASRPRIRLRPRVLLSGFGSRGTAASRIGAAILQQPSGSRPEARLPSRVHMEASEKPQTCTRRRRPTGVVAPARRPARYRAARPSRTSAPPGSSASAPRPGAARRRRSARRSRSAPGCSTARRRPRVDYVRAEFERHAASFDEQARRARSRKAPRSWPSGSPRPSTGRGTARCRRRSRALAALRPEEHRDAFSGCLRAEDGANPLSDFKGACGHACFKEPSATGSEARDRGQEPRACSPGGLAARSRELASARHADERVAEAEEAGTRKGRTFEELVTPRSRRSPSAQGDAARPHRRRRPTRRAARRATRSSRSVRRSAAPRGDGRLRGQEQAALEERRLDRAQRRHARARCTYASSSWPGDDKVPAGSRGATEYQGNKIIAVLDREDPDPLALRLVYRYVRARVLATGAATSRSTRPAFATPPRRLLAERRVKSAQTGIRTLHRRHQCADAAATR